MRKRPSFQERIAINSPKASKIQVLGIGIGIAIAGFKTRKKPIPMPIPMFLVAAKPGHDNLQHSIRELRWRDDDLKLHLSLAQALACAFGL
jgi:hypothetical protein